MGKTPDGGQGGGPASSYAEVSRANGMVPLIAGTRMNYADEAHSPRERPHFA